MFRFLFSFDTPPMSCFHIYITSIQPNTQWLSSASASSFDQIFRLRHWYSVRLCYPLPNFDLIPAIPIHPRTSPSNYCTLHIFMPHYYHPISHCVSGVIIHFILFYFLSLSLFMWSFLWTRTNYAHDVFCLVALTCLTNLRWLILHILSRN